MTKEELIQRTQKAAKNHERGYNCAQAVACAFSDLAGMDEADLFRLTEGLGLGMGCMEGTCGAISDSQYPVRSENQHCTSGPSRLQSGFLQAGTYLHGSLSEEKRFRYLQRTERCRNRNGTSKLPGCVEDAVEILATCVF